VATRHPASPLFQPRGFLALVLHAHLPYVRHPECDFFLEETWFFEAITETYIPLLLVFENLINDGIPFRLTMTMTPTLCSMLTDRLLQERYLGHLDRQIELAKKELLRTRHDPRQLAIAHMYLVKHANCRRVFADVHDRNLVAAFRALQDAGFLEIITCGATHGFFPAMQYNSHAVKAQIRVARQTHETLFGRKPAGIWLPECGYYPGLERLLEEAGITYLFTDSHGILFAEPCPRHGVYTPVYCKGTTVAAFARDIESSKAVWSSKEGYPGDAAYREYYRDIGFDLDMEYIRPYIDPSGIRINTGFKYHRITGPTERKELYDREAALSRAADHAGDFMFNRERQAERLAAVMDRPPIIVAPYDAELFGHWWYEGPEWLNYLIRKIHFEQDSIALVTPSDYLAAYPTNQICTPSFSSWGDQGYAGVWLDESNDWIYRHLHSMENRMVHCAQNHPRARGLCRRALNQMARELLLAQSSDWAFIMKTGTMTPYAVRRTREHIANFKRLSDGVGDKNFDANFISLLESHDNIFPEIDYRVYT
jgi:1,4-alpha-glucan branching enzyme